MKYDSIFLSLIVIDDLKVTIHPTKTNLIFSVLQFTVPYYKIYRNNSNSTNILKVSSKVRSSAGCICKHKVTVDSL